jgi:hypothetical protein
MSRLLAVLLAIWMAACGGGNTSEPSSTTVPTVKVFGWVKFVETGPERYVVDFDEAQFLTGTAAAAAAAADGAESPPPNDFYIRNSDPALIRYELDPSAVVELTGEAGGGGGITTFPTTVAEWTAWTVGSGAPTGWVWYGQALLPFWLTVENGRVVEVTEQYLP